MYFHNKHPKVSIIIPVYNVEQYITKCAESLLQQTYPNIEYIFINDASTDNSLKELRSTTDKYPSRNIIILDNKSNKGSSTTRNIGIELATGDYINFCDSDDWVESTAIEEMVATAIFNNADVVATPFYTNTFKTENVLYFPSSNIADLNSIPINFQHFSLCNKLIRASILQENNILSLPGIDCWEDLSITSRIFALTSSVVLLNKPFYHYRKYEYHSLTSDSHERQLNDRLRYTEFLIKWFTENNLSTKYTKFLNHLKFTAKIKMLRTTPKQFRLWKRTYPESNKHIMSYTDIPLHYRILFYLANKIIR